MNIIAWLLLGLVAGFIAHMVDPRETEGGLLATTITGVLGALLGGFLASLVFGVGISGFNLTSVVIAIAGSLLLVFIQRAISRRV